MPFATNGPNAGARPSHVTLTFGVVPVYVRMTAFVTPSRISSVQSLKFASVMVVLIVVSVAAVELVLGANTGLLAVGVGNDGEVLSTVTPRAAVTGWLPYG